LPRTKQYRVKFINLSFSGYLKGHNIVEWCSPIERYTRGACSVGCNTLAYAVLLRTGFTTIES
jgi:hypothetical protein